MPVRVAAVHRRGSGAEAALSSRSALLLLGALRSMTTTNPLAVRYAVGRSLALLTVLLSAAPCFAATISEPSKSDYCRVLDLADCDALVSFAEQQRLTVQGGRLIDGRQSVLQTATFKSLIAPGSAESMTLTRFFQPGLKSNCMVITFKSRAAAANVARVRFYWVLRHLNQEENKDFMLVYNDAGTEPALRLDVRDGSIVRSEVWAARTSAGGYRLRWCLVAGDLGARSGELYLDSLSITEFAVTASVTVPTADNRVNNVPKAGFNQIHNLTIGIEWSQLAESGELEPVASGFDLRLLSESDLVYQSPTSPLDQSFTVGDSGMAEKTLNLWLPQARVPRSQKLLLFVQTAVLRDDMSLQIPAADPNAGGLALNRACQVLADSGGGASLCDQSRLLLPGNGTGEWTSLRSPLVLEDFEPSCMRLGIMGLQYERGTFIRFRMDSTEQPNSILDFYVGDATEPSGRLLGPDFGEPISHLLDVSGELLLRFCFSVSAGAGDSAALIDFSDGGWSPAEALTAADSRALCAAVLDLDANACAELQSLRYVDGSNAAAVRPQVFPNAPGSLATASIRNDANGRSVGDTIAEAANGDNFAIFDNGSTLEVDELVYALANVAEGSDQFAVSAIDRRREQLSEPEFCAGEPSDGTAFPLGLAAICCWRASVRGLYQLQSTAGAVGGPESGPGGAVVSVGASKPGRSDGIFTLRRWGAVSTRYRARYSHLCPRQ